MLTFFPISPIFSHFCPTSDGDSEATIEPILKILDVSESSDRVFFMFSH